MKLSGLPTIFVKRKLTGIDPQTHWHWPTDNLQDDKIETEDASKLEKLDKRKASLQKEPSINIPKPSTTRRDSDLKLKKDITGPTETKPSEDKSIDSKEIVVNVSTQLIIDLLYTQPN